MTKLHENVLRAVKADLVKFIRPEAVCTSLESAKVITTEEANNIKIMKTKRERVESLVDLIRAKPDAAFSGFIKALEKNEETVAVHIIYKKLKGMQMLVT